jgi:hypothetical protein
LYTPLFSPIHATCTPTLLLSVPSP